MSHIRGTRRSVVLGMAALGLGGCGSTASIASRGNVDQVHIIKSQRKLYLVEKGTAFAEYFVDLGFAPEGHKLREGDGRTPEGFYWIDRKNPNSSFHLSLGITYPNERDIQIAKALNVDPGGDIFIHGRPNGSYDALDPDWTAGCIAVTNRQIEEIYRAVPIGTAVTIAA